MALHRTDTMRMEAVRVASRLKLSVKNEKPPTVLEVIEDAEKLNAYYRDGSKPDA